MGKLAVKKGEPSYSNRYYDQTQKHLVYIGQSATPKMWDALWTTSEQAIRDAVKSERGTKWLIRLTRRYLAKDVGKILEGGCGPGHNVAALRRAGYETVGIDFARETVVTLRRVAPELKILLGDLRRLPFADDSFSGYWSVGVIEHFYSGYQHVAQEMARVIRPHGYVFLTFPYMSPLRRLRARFGRYPSLTNDREPAGFYQFALDAAQVAREFKRVGFTKLYQSSMSGLQGFKDEVDLVHKPLQSLHDYSGSSLLVRGLRFMMEGLALLGAGHSCIMVLQKN